MRKGETSARRDPDWVARTLALLSIGVAIISLVHTWSKDRITLQQGIEPTLECHMVPAQARNESPTFALRNTSPISLSSITVNLHPILYSASPLRGVACGAPNSKFDDVPGFYWSTIGDLPAGEIYEKKVDSSLVPRDKYTGTAALFEITYYRPGDMKRFNEQCLYFMTPDGLVKTSSELTKLPGYSELFLDIQECAAYKRQSQQELIHKSGPMLGQNHVGRADG